MILSIIYQPDFSFLISFETSNYQLQSKNFKTILIVRIDTKSYILIFNRKRDIS